MGGKRTLLNIAVRSRIDPKKEAPLVDRSLGQGQLRKIEAVAGALSVGTGTAS
jgi:hypothetical protein